MIDDKFASGLSDSCLSQRVARFYLTHEPWNRRRCEISKDFEDHEDYPVKTFYILVALAALSGCAAYGPSESVDTQGGATVDHTNVDPSYPGPGARVGVGVGSWGGRGVGGIGIGLGF